MLLTELPEFTINLLTFKSAHTWCNGDITMDLINYDSAVITSTDFSSDGVSDHVLTVDIEQLRQVVTSSFTYEIKMGVRTLQYTADIIMYECQYNTVWSQNDIVTTKDPTYTPEDELGTDFFLEFRSMTMNYPECSEVFSQSIVSSESHSTYMTLVESLDPNVDNKIKFSFPTGMSLSEAEEGDYTVTYNTQLG